MTKYYRAVLGDIVVEAETWDEASKKIDAKIKAGEVPILSIEHDPHLDEEEKEEW